MHSQRGVTLIQLVSPFGDGLTDQVKTFDDTVPDGAVREIDYPPQLS